MLRSVAGVCVLVSAPAQRSSASRCADCAAPRRDSQAWDRLIAWAPRSARADLRRRGRRRVQACFVQAGMVDIDAQRCYKLCSIKKRR
jgi:hypothetical protein